MIRIPIREYVVSGAGKDVYIPAPCRGIVTALVGSFSETVAADDTVDVQRSSTSVNKITVGSGNTAEAVLLTGTPDTTNNELEFDPDSDTAANRVFKIAISQLIASATTFTGYIEFDEYVITDQT